MKYAVDVAFVAPAVVVMVVSARAFRCNVRRFRAAWPLAPLAGIDLSSATVRPAWGPGRWPDIDTVDDAPVAAGYAALADDRALSCTLMGELLVVIGGAAIGTGLGNLRDLGWTDLLLLAELVIVGVGIIVRLPLTRRWELVAARYRQRYAVLMQQPAPPAPVRRRRWWQRGPTA